MFNKFSLLNSSITFALAIFSIALGNGKSPQLDDLELIKEKSFKISSGKNLLIELSSGDVKVTYWNNDEVNVKIFGNENAMEKMSFTMEGTEELVKIIGKKKSSVSSWFSNVDVEVEIKVPSQFNLDISTAGGDIKCGGITGSASLNTSGGDIWADKFSGVIDASTSGGDIFLFCKDAKINGETSGGDIKLEYVGENRGVDLSTSGGDIDIFLSRDFAASIELSTSGGDVSCSLTMTNTKKSSNSKLVGDLNGGGENLSAHTSGGDISVSEK